MNNLDKIKDYIGNSLRVKEKMLGSEDLLKSINEVVDLCVSALDKGNKIIFAGNGGSAADSQHLAAEFVSRFNFDRPGLPSIALTTDTSMLTAIGNDYGYEKVFSRQLQANGKAGDVFFGISTSGNSKNIVAAVAEAKQHGIITVSLCGEGGVLPSMTDYTLAAPSNSTPHIQECHIVIGHLICGLVEEAIFKES